MVNLNNTLDSISDYFSPKIVGEVNDHFVKAVKILGDSIPWHIHKGEDEAFFVIDGELLMELEHESPFKMKKGDLFVVKKGVNHRVSSDYECRIMLIEPKSTKHTGTVKASITKSLGEQLLHNSD